MPIASASLFISATCSFRFCRSYERQESQRRKNSPFLLFEKVGAILRRRAWQTLFFKFNDRHMVGSVKPGDGFTVSDFVLSICIYGYNRITSLQKFLRDLGGHAKSPSQGDGSCVALIRSASDIIMMALVRQREKESGGCGAQS